jgi:cytochrome c oxidase subunit 2
MIAALAVSVASASAHPLQDVLRPAGPQAAHIAQLWWLMLAVGTAVLAAVVVATVWAVARARRRPSDPHPDAARDSRAARYVSGAVALSVVLLAVLFIGTLLTERALARLPLDGALHIELTGYQWWWQVRYDDPDPARIFTTANEIHIPVGRPVIVTLRASDVIHSLWVPNLAGKKDLIPGRETTMSLRADTAGEYRAQCAEFCGYQHARMALFVIAQPQADYDNWVDTQRKPAPEPADDLRKRGRQVFETSTCAMCHAIQGTKAQATRGPDLTHVAGRRSLGAGVLANTSADRAAWVVDAQAVKPGVNMPPQPLSHEDLQAILAYLDTLQ